MYNNCEMRFVSHRMAGQVCLGGTKIDSIQFTIIIYIFTPDCSVNQYLFQYVMVNPYYLGGGHFTILFYKQDLKKVRSNIYIYPVYMYEDIEPLFNCTKVNITQLTDSGVPHLHGDVHIFSKQTVPQQTATHNTGDDRTCTDII